MTDQENALRLAHEMLFRIECGYAYSYKEWDLKMGTIEAALNKDTARAKHSKEHAG